MQRILGDCGLKQSKPTISWCDNRSAIAIVKNPELHGRIKHIDIRFHYIRDMVFDGVIKLEHCDTNMQITDIFTKPLGVQKHWFITTLLGVCEFQSSEAVESDWKLRMAHMALTNEKRGECSDQQLMKTT